MVIFDLDGTLVDSAGEIAAAMEVAWRSVLPQKPFPGARVRIGPPLAQMIARLDESLDPSEQKALFDAFRERYDASDFSRTVPYPGIDRVLGALGRCRLATNKRLPPTLKITARWFPGAFEKIACSDGVWPDDGARTPTKPEMLRWLAGSATGSAVLVGDTAADVAAARSVGLRAVAVTWGYDDERTLVAASPDAVVRHTGELLALLRRIP